MTLPPMAGTHRNPRHHAIGRMVHRRPKNPGKDTTMKYVSMFPGIEAATVAWKQPDRQPAAFPGIEPFPCAAPKHHHPTVPNLADMTKADWNDHHHTADIVVGGSPCNSFSTEGPRKALDDPRGQPMPAYSRACQQIDPEWIVRGKRARSIIRRSRARFRHTPANRGRTLA